MLSIELLKSVVTKVIGDAASRVFSQGIDAKRRFAREMLTYYENVKDYKAACSDLVALIRRERQLVPNGRVTPGSAKRFQEISDKMSSLVETLLYPFEHEWEADIRVMPKHPTARRNLTLLELYDTQLVQALQSGHFVDTRTSYLAAQMSKQYIDWERQEIKLFPPIGANPFDEPQQDHGFTHPLLMNASRSNFQAIKISHY